MIGPARQTLQVFPADDLRAEPDPLHHWTLLSFLELQRETKRAPEQNYDGNAFVSLRERTSDGQARVIHEDLNR